MIRRRGARSLSIFAFAACLLAVPTAAGAEVLYDQTDAAVTPTSDSSGPNFSPSNELPISPDRTADDFTIPDGETWTINEIDVAGAFSALPESTVNVYLYADDGAKPGTELLTKEDVAASGGPNYSVPVTGAPQLGTGKYWLTIQQANITGGEYWSWGTRSIQSGSPAQWKTAGGAPGCPPDTWTQRSVCWVSASPDQTFKLSGTVTGRVAPPPPLSGDFSFGKTSLNKKKGTAKLAVVVQNAGHIDASGKGVAKQSIDASGAGTVTVLVKPNGRVAKKLKKGGKATVSVEVTFTAAGVAPNTETMKLKLKRKKK